MQSWRERSGSAISMLTSADRLGFVVAEHALRRAAEGMDDAPFVGDDHAVERRLHDRAEMRGALGDLLGQPDLVVRVDQHPDDAVDAAIASPTARRSATLAGARRRRSAA